MAGRKTDGGTESIHRALTHPIRVHALLRIAEKGKLSPTAYHQAEGISLSLASYHFRELEKFGAIECVAEGQRRGAVEHFYAIRDESPVLQALLVSRLLGSTDGSRASRVAQLKTVRVDSVGVEEIESLVAEVMPSKFLEVEARSGERIAKSGEAPTYLHCGSAAFENFAKARR
ncbi:MAG TPA: helix-turn-helix domain-containing protein [Solirubrobacterales bacterium]|nr:helix-turn-helix domain-containing protein [Solirubrobacterales bacterium]